MARKLEDVESDIAVKRAELRTLSEEKVALTPAPAAQHKELFGRVFGSDDGKAVLEILRKERPRAARLIDDMLKE